MRSKLTAGLCARPLLVFAVVCLLTWAGGAAGQTAAPPQESTPRAESTSGEVKKPAGSAPALSSAAAATLEGKVKSGNTPIPGATVTATNSASGGKVVGWTQADGSYQLALPALGEYSVRVQMVAFAAAEQKVQVAAGKATRPLDFHITLSSRSESTAGGTYARGGGAGFQALSVIAGEGGGATGGESNESVAPSGMPVPGVPPTVSTESVAVSGSSSATNMFGMSTDELRSRMQGMGGQQGMGGPGGPGGGGGFGPGGGGGQAGFGGPPGGVMLGRSRFNLNKPHGTFYYTANTASLNAEPYSLTGAPVENPGYLQQRFGVSIGGPLNIPHIYHGGSKTFYFLNYNGAYGDHLYNYLSTVPTDLERSGDFSQTLVNGQPVQIYDPKTGQPFPNATIPQNQINSAAQGLLSYIPLPNLPGTTQNFQYIGASTNNTTDLNFRLNQALGGASAGTGGPGGGGRRRGPQNNLNFGFHYHAVDQTLTSAYPSVGGHTNTTGYDIPIGYVRSFGRLINNFRFDFNRSSISTTNLYAYKTDITGDLGITGVSQTPFTWGLPNLSFTHYGGISDTLPVNNRNQTWTFSDNMIWSHGKHTLRWGGDFRRIQINTQTDSNPRGSFVFTGAYTSLFANGQAVAGTGYDLADFLLGAAQQTSLQYGNDRYYFRGNSWDLYVQDEWRMRGNLTINAGLRYEYVSPLSESNNRIVNLDTNPGFTQVAPVYPNQVGSLSGMYYPGTLVNPNRNNFAPRIGIAWKAAKNTVVRAGYGINYNTAAYQNIVQNMAFQPPFSNTQTNVASSTNVLTLQDGFPGSPGVTNNYGIGLNYGLGYVQIWNVDIQQQVTRSLLINIDYTGTKGTRLDVLTAPNSTASGIRIPGVQPFYYESSDGDSTANAGSLRVRKRLTSGISAGGTFTWSKSIDDASTIGAGSSIVSGNGRISGVTVVAQNAFDLAAERGLSSFNQEFRFTGDYLWELPFGKGRRWLTSPGPAQEFLGGWQWSGDWTVASGLPFTPRLIGSFSNVNSGVNGTLRGDVTGAPVGVPNPSIGEWFNTSAFVTPPAGQYGNARRNSIIGPGEVLFDMAMTKLIQLKETRSLELRIAASNVFNHPIYSGIDSVLNSPTYGQVISVSSMRSVQMTARFRF
jgi:trimeric autotransporter adhesin